MTMEDVIETTTPEPERADMLVEQAQEAFDVAVEALRDSCKKLRAEPAVGEDEVSKAVRQMNGAYMLAMTMREKAHDAGSKRFGASGAGQLDLGAARSEIGLRLACLRDAVAGAGVSGEPG
ncbi:hypothetical protein [Gymnodinialimonas hymeniacidonis]|uniref:hypothetical protein n=1 Tax=Gymnodinialimonas hymeniacidonis TaxID=3126508 RepID=UPI0034C62207